MDQTPPPTNAPPDQLSDWVEISSERCRTSKSNDPGQYVSRIRGLSWIFLGVSLVPLVGGYLLASGRSLELILAYVLTCVIVGMMETLAATAWGAMIAMTESGRCGSLFVVFPPYMLYYAATRWQWMAQPTILFLSGLGLAFGGIIAGRHLLDAS